ncbi:hypothetical protein Hanom_Chr07g00592421 [Helianthus anomalus]
MGETVKIKTHLKCVFDSIKPHKHFNKKSTLSTKKNELPKPCFGVNPLMKITILTWAHFDPLPNSPFCYL